MIGMIRWIVAAGVMTTASDGYGAAGGRRAGGSSLPFTGLDLLLYAVIAAAIIAAGLALRAVAQRKDR